MFMSARHYLWIALGLSAALLCASFILQYHYGLEPCPLCYIQRGALIATIPGIVFALRAYRPTVGHARWLIGWSTLGLLGSLRQVWIGIQYPNMPADCLPPLGELLRYVPWTDVLKSLLARSAGCSGLEIVLWKGVTISQATLLCFTLLVVLGVFVHRKTRKSMT